MTDKAYELYLERHRAYNRAYREKHRAELNAKRREYYRKNREKEIQRAKNYYMRSLFEVKRAVTV